MCHRMHFLDLQQLDRLLNGWFGSNWNHLDNLTLADPDFRWPGRVDILLGVDLSLKYCCMAGRLDHQEHQLPSKLYLDGYSQTLSRSLYHVSSHSGCNWRRFATELWEIEENAKYESCFSSEERFIVQHFEENHGRAPDGKFIVPLLKWPCAPPLGESRSHAIQRFSSLEHSLHAQGVFEAFDSVIREYFDLEHAEPVPSTDLEASSNHVF